MLNMRILKMKIWMLLLLLFNCHYAFAQSPIGVGTTAGEFLSVGYGPAALAVGDAYVSRVNDISSVYWNPAGLAFMQNNEVMFSYQPWLVDINSFFSAAGLVIPEFGTLAVGLIGMDYGDMNVTTVEMQDGTGEIFSAQDYAFYLSFGRKLATWFGFGASVKYINSSIWHSSASSIALDLGVVIETSFLSPTGSESDGLKIGMSLSNYGQPMQYDGLDLIRSVDISPDEAGNYKDSRAQLSTNEWDLPLIFRVGVSVQPITTSAHQVTLSADALHVNSNSESVNLGAEYLFAAPGIARIFFRAGYRALFMDDSEFGLTFGFGVHKQFFGNTSFGFDYTFREFGILGNVNTWGISVSF
jgi:hypothetical protein